MITYAMARAVPESTRYLTAGKFYKAGNKSSIDNMFIITDDNGFSGCICRWEDDCHLGMTNWLRFTEEERAAYELGAMVNKEIMKAIGA